MKEKKNAQEGREDMKEMNLTLLIMAAGIGSRFGGGIKQLEPVDARDISLWIIPSMMRWKPDSTRLCL